MSRLLQRRKLPPGQAASGSRRTSCVGHGRPGHNGGRRRRGTARPDRPARACFLDPGCDRPPRFPTRHVSVLPQRLGLSKETGGPHPQGPSARGCPPQRWPPPELRRTTATGPAGLSHGLSRPMSQSPEGPGNAGHRGMRPASGWRAGRQDRPHAKACPATLQAFRGPAGYSCAEKKRKEMLMIVSVQNLPGFCIGTKPALQSMLRKTATLWQI